MLEPTQPFVDHFEPLTLEPVHARTASFLKGNQTGSFQHAQMPSSSWPGVAKAAGDFSRSHTATAKFHG
ncbi:MAG: hypothetical protein JWM21_3658 [Acidobacteria bacterium]|nr:hypothetical protein [Acidobacteriota bacterium]